MKKIGLSILLIQLALVSFAVQEKVNCKIQGNVLQPNGGLIFIKNLTQTFFDTLEVKDNKFTYSCFVSETTPFILSNEENKYQVFFAEPKSVIQLDYIQPEYRISKVIGSPSQAIFESLLQRQSQPQQEAAKIQQIYTNSLNQDSLNTAMTQINKTLESNYFNFLKENGQTEVAAFVVYSSIANDQHVTSAVADKMFQYLKGTGLNSYFGKQTSKLVSKLKAVEIGNIAPDFTLPDATGFKSYTLSKLQGKYVLIDFWASWCGPCKQEIPNLKNAYEKFHDKDFEIISVSLDDKKEAWLNALTQFNMPWIQVSDSKGFKSVVNELYHIPSIPKTLLLDKTGKIIATDLRGNELELKLAEINGRANDK